MTSLTVFLTAAAVMVITACAVLIVPLLKRNDTAPVAAGGVLALLPLSVVGLYLVFSNWPWQSVPQTAASPDIPPSVVEMVAGLEQRLRNEPDNQEGWQMLGRSYVVMGRYTEAVEAYAQARQLSDDKDVHALTGQAEALAMSRGGELQDDSVALFERALEMAPDDRKALWYGGLAAYERGQYTVAKSRWQHLLTFEPPPQMEQLLREQIAAVDALQGGADVVVSAGSQAAAGVSVEVTLDGKLKTRAPSDATVFVLARPVGGSGPPLAVVRRKVSDLPFKLVLSDADAMVPGRTISGHDQVEIVARISLGGTPAAQTGDLYGAQVVSQNGDAAIAIDQVY